MTRDTDLILSRSLAADPARLWRCWTEPALIVRWFAPAPVETLLAEIEPRPGGRFRTVMRLPDGQEMDSAGCILLAEPARRLVFTDCLLPGFRPAREPFFTADITFEAEGAGTLYTARALHARPQEADRHAEMGFHQGWGAATEQLDRLARSL